MLRYIDTKNGNFAATAGTVNCGNYRQVNFQVALDQNSGHEVVVRPTLSAAATISKTSYAALVSDNGVYEAKKPAGVGSNNWYLTYRVYNGASVATATSANDKYAAERWG